MRFFNNTVIFNNQLYEECKKKCTTSNELFVDSMFDASYQDFPKNDVVLNLDEIVWKRPKEIYSNPKFISDFKCGILNGPISNPKMGACLAAIRGKDVIKKVILDMDSQNLNAEKPESYVGIFKFCFWKCGEWVEVVVDDLLPTKDDKVLSVTADNEQDFWCALLEKAYAKVSGSYAGIYNHTEEEMLLEFTGGMPEMIIADVSQGLLDKCSYELLKTEFDNRSIILAQTKESSSEDDNLYGLEPGKLMSLTKIMKVNIRNTSLSAQTGKEELCVLRMSSHTLVSTWKGEFSEESIEWNQIYMADKVRLGMTYSTEGDFWLSFTKFVEVFGRVLIMRFVNKDLISAIRMAIARVPLWCVSSNNECWYGAADSIENALVGKGGGGQYYFENTTDTSLMFLVHIVLRCKKELEVPISIVLFKVEFGRKTVMMSCRWGSEVLQHSVDKTRSIGFSRNLEPGAYVIKAYIKGDIEDNMNYHIRVASSDLNNGRFLLMEPDRSESLVCFCNKDDNCVITRIQVIGVTILSEDTSYSNVYCTIDCGDLEYKTHTTTLTEKFKWDWSVLLYRFNLSSPIIFKVSSKNMIADSLIGRAQYCHDAKYVDKDPMQLTLDLVNRKGRRTGKLDISMWHTRSLANL